MNIKLDVISQRLPAEFKTIRAEIMAQIGDGLSLAGVDLDTCFITEGPNEIVAPWGEAVIDRFSSYTEFSPSGTGVKIFFLAKTEDLSAARKAIDDHYSREWKLPGDEHPPGIELHLSRRFFTVTAQHVSDTPRELHLVDLGTPLWLINEAGPALIDNGRDAETQPRDKSRSGVAYRIGQTMFRAGKSFEEFCDAVRDNPETADWYAEKGIKNNNRELRRIWEKVELNNSKDTCRSTHDQLLMRKLSDITMRPVIWAWPKVIPYGKIMLIAGNPKLGKSSVALSFAATLTANGSWPDGTQCREPCSVVIMSTEDDPADTIKPRLVAVGGDCSRCHIIDTVYRGNGEERRQRMFDIEKDLSALEQRLQEDNEIGLIIIDPIAAHVTAKDAYNDAEIRRKLAGVARLAEDYCVAVVGVMHFHKGQEGGAPIHQIAGSLAYGAVVRVVYGVVKDKNDPDRRLFVSMGNNFARNDLGFAYRIKEVRVEKGITARAIDWEGPVEITVEEAMAKDPEPAKAHVAAAWLRARLAAGPVAAKQIEAEAKAQKMSWRTVQRASEKLVHKEKNGFQGEWMWSLKPEA